MSPSDIRHELLPIVDDPAQEEVATTRTSRKAAKSLASHTAVNPRNGNPALV